MNTLVNNLLDYNKEQRDSVIDQRANAIVAFGLTVPEVKAAIDQEIQKRKAKPQVHVQPTYHAVEVAQQQEIAQVNVQPKEQVSFPNYIISETMSQTQPFSIPTQMNQEQNPQVRFQETNQAIVEPTVVKSGKQTLKERFVVENGDEIKPTKTKTQNITQRTRGTGVMQHPDAAEFKWNPNDAQDRFSMKGYQRPNKNLADKFGPSVEELQNNLPSEQDLSKNSDSQIMPKKFRMGRALDQASNRTTSDHVGTVGFRSKGNLKKSNEASLRRKQNLDEM